jgi:hypothetical protein
VICGLYLNATPIWMQNRTAFLADHFGGYEALLKAPTVRNPKTGRMCLLVSPEAKEVLDNEPSMQSPEWHEEREAEKPKDHGWQDFALLFKRGNK